jgi:hypothetical protein
VALLATTVDARARTALADALRRACRNDGVDERGYADRLEDNLFAGLSSANVVLIRDEFGAGAGAELDTKMRAAHSSSALAVNNFARWRNSAEDLRHLRLAAADPPEDLEFECRCHSGLRGIPPHLDLVLRGREGIVAVESKCTEQLVEHSAAFREAYREKIEAVAHPTWAAQYDALVRDACLYRYLNAAQLVKHYLGLKNTFPDRKVTLLYLFWEPLNVDELPALLEHRDDVAQFATDLADPHVAFESKSYPELWDAWSQQPLPEWLPEHVERLRARYGVEL